MAKKQGNNVAKAPTGDDLDDDLDVDPAFLGSPVASGSGSSLHEDQAIGEIDDSVDDEAFFSDEDDGETKSKASVKHAGVKRKADAEEDEATKAAEKKRRKKEREKRRKARRNQAQSPSAFSKPLSHLSMTDLSDLLVSSIRDTYPAASPMEIDDLRIPEDNLLLPSESSLDQLGEGGSSLKDRLQPFMTDKKIPVSTPRVIVLALSGLRCVDVVREVKTVPGNGEVAKLFAKHLKYEDQVKYMAQNRVGVAVGTPARVGRLLAEGAMKVTKQTVVLLDASFHDSKQRTLLTLPEARTELWKSVFSGGARDALLTGGAKIGAFLEAYASGQATNNGQCR